jgi:hypothetical protein
MNRKDSVSQLSVRLHAALMTTTNIDQPQDKSESIQNLRPVEAGGKAGASVYKLVELD